MCSFAVYSKIIQAGGERMKKIDTKVLKLVERVARHEAKGLIDRFPPPCLGIWHQPQRPNTSEKK